LRYFFKIQTGESHILTKFEVEENLESSQIPDRPNIVRLQEELEESRALISISKSEKQLMVSAAKVENRR
jgi:hypothetical protein